MRDFANAPRQWDETALSTEAILEKALNIVKYGHPVVYIGPAEDLEIQARGRASKRATKLGYNPNSDRPCGGLE